MVLAFYKTDNTKRFNRHSFDGMKPKEILDNLLSLFPEEWFAYESSNAGNSTNFPSLSQFVEDYNDEILSGYWAVAIETN